MNTETIKERMADVGKALDESAARGCAAVEIPGGDAAHGMRRAGEGSEGFSPERGARVNMSFEDYLATPAVSKSTLWTAITRSAAHARTEKEESNAMKLGTAVHCAVLEPDSFRERFHRGPEDRRGLKWKEAVEEHGRGVLTSGDYDTAIALRDALSQEPLIRKILSGAAVEASGFWSDTDTGLLCRCRPDAWNPKINVIADLKVTGDARPDVFKRRVAEFGYHAQEAFYTDGWRACGFDVSAFLFIAVEPTPPYGFALYELEPLAVLEGREAMRLALDHWKYCVDYNHWKPYVGGVQPLDIPKWAYRFTNPTAA